MIPRIAMKYHPRARGEGKGGEFSCVCKGGSQILLCLFPPLEQQEQRVQQAGCAPGSVLCSHCGIQALAPPALLQPRMCWAAPAPGAGLGGLQQPTNSCKARREHLLWKQNMVWNDFLDIQSSQRIILEEMGAGEAQDLFFSSNL